MITIRHLVNNHLLTITHFFLIINNITIFISKVLGDLSRKQKITLCQNADMLTTVIIHDLIHVGKLYYR